MAWLPICPTQLDEPTSHSVGDVDPKPAKVAHLIDRQKRCRPALDHTVLGVVN